ncbi:hypothetical protein ACHAXA_006135 [Cyclostephanos tholiformis]|uniref:Peptidylprolyl isomerase n=1 Tax=Cyclostephanos tholiformis TaxID=382380 RepID=A0ABD3RAJ4_9STRA
MGYDANVKSRKSEQRQRLMMIGSLIALSAAFLLVVSLLPPSPLPVAPAIVAIEKNAADIMTKPLRRGDTKIAGDAVVASSKISNKVKSAATGMAMATVDDQRPQPRSSPKSEMEAAAARALLEARVREIKKTGVIMEVDEESLKMTRKLQEATREVLKLRYGDFGSKNYRVELILEFQPSIPDYAEKGKDGSIIIEMAPISLVPCSVYNFMEIARTWKSGAFRRNAGHVLQALARSNVTESMPFQEYSEEYPHKKGTVGYAGRPSGPEFYVSIADNSKNHGPGSQQKKNPYEADCIIGTVVKGMEDGTVARVHKMPGQGFLSNKDDWVLIRAMRILVPGDGPDGYVEFSKPLEST